MVSGFEAAWEGADAILKIHPPTAAEAALLGDKAIVSPAPRQDEELVATLAEQGACAFALDAVRCSRILYILERTKRTKRTKRTNERTNRKPFPLTHSPRTLCIYSPIILSSLPLPPSLHPPSPSSLLPPSFR